MNRFISVYEQIRKIDFRPGDGILELYTNALSVRQVEELEIMTATSMQPLSEKELAVNCFAVSTPGKYIQEADLPDAERVVVQCPVHALSIIEQNSVILKGKAGLEEVACVLEKTCRGDNPRREQQRNCKPC